MLKLDDEPRHLKRRRIRFSLLTFLLVFTGVSIALGVYIHFGRLQQRAIDVVEGHGGTLVYEHQRAGGAKKETQTPGPKWKRLIFGDKCYAKVIEVHLSFQPEQFDDHDAAWLSAFVDATWLDLMDTNITDEGLKHLMGLTKLERLDLGGTRVTPAGAYELKRSLPKARIYLGPWP